MRQVPQYLIIGRGRVAKHVTHYLSLLNLPYQQWHRAQTIDQLQTGLAWASHVLLLINDSAITEFAAQHLADYSGTIVHFSGSVSCARSFGAHPLQTFSQQHYSRTTYEAIPFVIDADAPEFSSLLPGLPNQFVRLDQTKKTKYHAMCVLAGNFSTLLWQKLFRVFEDELQLPKEIAFQYMQQQMNNLQQQPAHALTGPLVRHDVETIKRHLAVLEDDDYQQIYKNFVNSYSKSLRQEVE